MTYASSSLLYTNESQCWLELVWLWWLELLLVIVVRIRYVRQVAIVRIGGLRHSMRMHYPYCRQMQLNRTKTLNIAGLETHDLQGRYLFELTIATMPKHRHPIQFGRMESVT